MRTIRPLTDKERSNLEIKLKQAKNVSNWKRIFVILNYDDGFSIEELAKLTRLSTWTIEEYLKLYSSKQKTDDDPRGGSSSKLTESETSDLIKHLTEVTYLKVGGVIGYVKKAFGKKYSRSGMTDWLTRNGFTFKKPEKIPGKLDPSKQELFIEEYKKLKSSLAPCDELYFLDAIHPEYQSQAVCGWIRKGECKTLQTTAKQQRLHFVGALNLNEMKTVIREYETIDGESIVRFFEELEVEAAPGKIHIILDNAAAHKNRKVKEYLKKSRIELHFLPPYSPNLNPIERLWKFFRETTLYNRYFETCSDFCAVTREFFADKVHKLRCKLKERINDNFQRIKLNPIKLS